MESKASSAMNNAMVKPLPVNRLPADNRLHGRGGCDEMDEVSGDGHAELLDDGSIEITFAGLKRKL
jgi:hypothetical protein